MEIALEAPIRELEQKLRRSAETHPHLLAPTPAWWQQRFLDWANEDPDFRVKLLRFVDVLPTLRTASAVADHVRQYFRGSGPEIVQTASGIAAQPVFRPILSRVVRQGVFAMAHRFIAGASPAEALPALWELAQQGIGYTVDLLGEATLSDAEADAYLARYIALLETLAADRETIAPHGEGWQGVPPINISVKLSALCSHFEPAAPEHISAVIRNRLRSLLRLARQRGAFINVDLEQYRYKDLVHRTFADLVLEPEFADFSDIGIVVQAYLRDAEEDLARLQALAKRRGASFTIRLVKGAYWDEERIVASQNSWPVPVFEEKADTDNCFERCTDALLAAWPRLRPAFGTHNPRSVAQAIVKARARALRDSDLEFQVLCGMVEGLRTAVAAEGLRTRVYVPIGEIIPGMAYLVRRLLENTSNQAWFHAGLSEAAVQRLRPKVEKPPEREGRVFRNASPARFFDPDVRERMLLALANVRGSFGASCPLLIGERRVSGRPLAQVRYPAEPETVVGQVAQGSPADMDAAVALARAAFSSWRDRPAGERAAILRRAALVCAERIAETLGLLHHHGWKPRRRRLERAVREREEEFGHAFGKDEARFAMAWYYPVLCGVFQGRDDRRRLDSRRDQFLEPSLGVRCVSNRPWVTIAESCELAIALDAVGRRQEGRWLLGWQLVWQEEDGGFRTGTVEGQPWPDGQRPTWTAAAVVLAADALYDLTAGGELFRSLQEV